MKEFKIIIDGEEKNAELVTRLYVDELGLEYIYYYIKEDDDSSDTEKILLVSGIETDENGLDKIIPIETEEERKLAFKIFSDTYKDIDDKIEDLGGENNE